MQDNNILIKELYAKLRSLGNTFDPQKHGGLYHQLAGLVGYDNKELNDTVNSLLPPQYRR